MTKKVEEKVTEEQEAALIAARDANRPLAGQAGKVIDQETLSHQWQEGSGAVNTNVLSDHPNRDLNANILEKIQSPENLKAKEDAQKVLDDAAAEAAKNEDFDCSKLDVSDIRYCQPGSERHKAFKNKK